ncbi:RNA-directed DNA polymerase from mobile element jockey [Plakobranchus ocellatus]|uniref:RNA-directed DNA polymerase from mobile element jockey n=1 Tax=Plakobranchus ocellatus TaxID=259542 RepID=A0AAV4DTH6_9GAST|nr:RNA-directed DNA polymerase from mobile element jockey [Plakobranchus ocellatus]
MGNTDWDADTAAHRTLVRFKLGYGNVVYNLAKKHILRALDPIHHQGLRIALGAFKSLFVEAGEPSLEHRRIKLAFNYALKLKSLPVIRVFVFEVPLSDFSADSKSESNLVASTPWEEHKIKVDISLTEQKKIPARWPIKKKNVLELKKNFQTIMLYEGCPKRNRKRGITQRVLIR